MRFDFKALENANFKEDSVRELIIAPLLEALGFVPKSEKNAHKFEVIRTDRLKTDLQIGSNKRIEADLNPDYSLYVDSKLYCILDAKAPSESVEKGGKNYNQARSYALGFECPYFALCNGYKFVIYAFGSGELMLELELEKLDDEAKNNEFFNPKQDNPHFLFLQQFFTQEKTEKPKIRKPESWYLERPLPRAILKPQKQAKKRHYGCMSYFTRQSWDIVTQNIKNFTDEGDVVLDSFGGSGVTAIEAMMNGRLGIHTDLNPLSIFMVKALSAKVDLSELYDVSESILKEFENLKPKNEKEARQILKNAKYYPNAIDSEFGETATQKMQDSILWIPQDEILPKGSDVESVLSLFTKTQLAELALLRKLIFKHTTPSGKKEYRIYKRNLRYSLLLAFYNTITLINRTYHNAPKGGPASAVTRYYRYRIAPKPDILDTAETFRQKIERIKRGKEELLESPNDRFYKSYFHPLQRVIKDFSGALIAQRSDLDKTDSLLDKTNGEKIFQADATNLKEIESQSVDFIYTDPPYGAKIPYLDLSTMWNVWLDLPVDSSLKEKECIEKGSLEKSRYEYHDLMKQSLKEMYRVLKFNRWLAFVFQHQDPQLWQILVDSAENLGFEYAGSVRQDNGQSTFKKRQNPSTVLSGQIIIYFKKVDNAKVRAKLAAGFDVMEKMFGDIEEIIIDNNGASLEEIWNGLLIKAMDGLYLDKIAHKFETFIPSINERFELEEKSQKYHLRENTSFSNFNIPLESRVEYLVKIILGRAKEKGQGVRFDDIVLQVIPLSKNGIQANQKMVREILESVAYEDSKTKEWFLKQKERTLFD